MSIRLLSAVVVLVLAGVGLSLRWYLEAESATWRAQHTASVPLRPAESCGVPSLGDGVASDAALFGICESADAPASTPKAAGVLSASSAPYSHAASNVVSSASSPGAPVRPCSLPRVDLDLEFLDASPASRP